MQPHKHAACLPGRHPEVGRPAPLRTRVHPPREPPVRTSSAAEISEKSNPEFICVCNASVYVDVRTVTNTARHSSTVGKCQLYVCQ